MMTHSFLFLSQQHDISTAYVPHYDSILTILSYCIACLTAYTAWSISFFCKIEKNKNKKILWISAGGVIMGIGIWVMHFIGMLAYKLPISIHYDLTITLISMLPAILASMIAMSVITKQHLATRHYIFGSLLFGTGIVTMHYVGMAAMRMNAIMLHDPLLFIYSLLLAIGLAFVALKLKSITDPYIDHKHFKLINLSSILTMAAAIAGMHYTGMAAAYSFPIEQLNPQWINKSSTSLPLLVIVMTIFIILTTLLITIFKQQLVNTKNDIFSNRERMFEAIDSLSDGFVLFDSSDRLVMYNENFKKMYQELGEWIKPGITYQELIEKRALCAKSPIIDDPQEYLSQRLRWHSEPNNYFSETLNDGRHIFGKEQRTTMGDTVGIWTDISELKKVQNRLGQANKQIQMLLDSSPSPITIRAIADNEVLYFNQSAKRYFERNKFDLRLGSTKTFINKKHLGNIKNIVLEQSEINNVEWDFSAADGTDYTVELSAMVISYDNKPAILFSFVDISERHALEQRLESLSQTDPLTGVLNRSYLTDIGNREIARCQRNRQPLSLLLLDLDLFKSINEQYGHETGDCLIVRATQICSESVRKIDIIGRLEGEEFVVILADKNLEDAKIIAERIRYKIAEARVPINDQQLAFTVSIGISTILSDQPDGLQRMLSRADKQLVQAKQNGRNQISF